MAADQGVKPRSDTEYKVINGTLAGVLCQTVGSSLRLPCWRIAIELSISRYSLFILFRRFVFCSQLLGVAS